MKTRSESSTPLRNTTPVHATSAPRMAKSGSARSEGEAARGTGYKGPEPKAPQETIVAVTEASTTGPKISSAKLPWTISMTNIAAPIGAL